MRIGIGYDVHKLVAGRDLIIGGVEIPFAKGLLGHSDADVLTHAIMDALLGAAGLPDIGHFFPDNDEKYRGARSVELLGEVMAKIREQGFELGNVDAVIVAEKPKMAPHIEQIRRNLAEAMAVEVAQVGVKATTTEGLGFAGEGMGIAAQAVALLQKIS